MKNKSTPNLTCILIIVIVIISALYVNSLRGYLSDCRFECNSLQIKIDRLQELSGVIEAMNQALPPLALAQLKVIDKMIKDKRYREYERYEIPLLTEKEIDG